MISGTPASEGIHGPETFGQLAKKEKKHLETEHKFQNPDLAEKTQALQDEFEKVLSELNQRRAGKDGDVFY
jgi:hypothetical protein